jgi:putative glutamine amidotransferase
MKTLVISQRIDLFPDRDERRDALDQALIRFVNQAGYLAVPVPNAFVDTSALDFKEGELDFSVAISARVGKLLEAFLSHINPDGIVLSGGNDIGACLDRDLTEAILIRYAMKNEIPLLGICRGMQMLGVCMGTELREVENHVKIRHLLQGNLFMKLIVTTTMHCHRFLIDFYL